jgi:hypothetical protein
VEKILIKSLKNDKNQVDFSKLDKYTILKLFSPGLRHFVLRFDVQQENCVKSVFDP